MDGNPYTVVGAPQSASYAAPMLQFNPFGSSGGGQQRTPSLTQQYAQLLQKIMNKTNPPQPPGTPLPITPPGPSAGAGGSADPYGIDNSNSAYNQALIGGGGGAVASNPVLYGSPLY